jgi:glycosyltransferase involved in cell wall biosynthesis
VAEMKILFVHEVNYLDKVVFEMHEFPERLEREGHSVTFVDYAETSLTRSFRKRDRIITGRSEPLSRIRLVSLPQVLFGVSGRLVISLLVLLYCPLIIRRIRPQVVISYAVPTLGWQFRIWCKFYKIPYIYRAIDVSHLIRETRFSRLVQIAEKYLYRSSDLVLCNNDALCRYAQEQYGCQPDRSRVLYPAYEPSKNDPAETTSSRSLTTFVYNTVFMGTLFNFAGLDWFLRELSCFPFRGDIRLLIIGDGDEGTTLKKIVHDLGLSENVNFYGRAQFSELGDLLSRAHVAILPFNPTRVTHLALPGKVPQYIRSGVPCVATPLDGLKGYLAEGEGVLYSQPGQDFLYKLHRILNDENLRRQLVSQGNQVLNQQSSWSQQLQTLEEALTETISRHSPTR